MRFDEALPLTIRFLTNFRWNEQLRETERGHASLIDVVPKFAVKARWVKPAIPPMLASRSRHASDGRDTPTASPLRNSNGLPRSPRGATSATIASTSAMSRTMRAEILALDSARHNRSIHALSQYLAKAGQSLDELIDTSTTALPESFLDVQENLENAVTATTTNLATFLAGLAGTL